MKVHEYLAKRVLKAEGVRIPSGVLITREDILENLSGFSERLSLLGFPQVLKAQVLVGGRMKAGGVKIVKNLEESFEEIVKISQMEIKGERPYGVLVEEFIPHEKEMYLSISIDRNIRDIVIVFAPEGGIDVEEYSQKYPDRIIKSNNPEDFPAELRKLILKLKDVFVRYDLTLLEINPFVVKDGEFIALDAVFHVDDSALFRQLWLDEEMPESSFVKLHEGGVGVIGCGAGIVMATLDALVEHGFRPANFCDIGGGATAESVYNALNKVKEITNCAVLNIFGGITDCVEIAKGIINFKKQNPDFTLLIRLSGNNELLARKMLEGYNIPTVSDMKELIESLRKGGMVHVLSK
ncbi:succinyl-CoA synthetase beta subunit [Fervidobacterium changbaicum]|uniref:Succinate--CoA ligase n=2 Tax=Fervidobacterium TaxID=2422 RepID=A0AAI8GCP4_FERIS|nr:MULTISPECIES: ATP-grasp domain-containing protein [Fervidobacterium]AMW32168.1 succinate--CoA ligase [Fervidobacterium islandicum]QAV33939.1 succinate--CoA ligase [Fervidobacterium changbaicum]SDH56663.1 succinyl-CoA synthetase beta subunit [Fervidobacterium changbaicum]